MGAEKVHSERRRTCRTNFVLSDKNEDEYERTSLRERTFRDDEVNLQYS